MAKISGKGGWVQIGSDKIVDMTKWSISGTSMDILRADPAFDDSMVKKVGSGITDPGTLSFSGNYDPSDSTGQRGVITTLKAGAGITDLYLYVNTSTMWRVASGGTIIVTRADAVDFPRMGYGTISFEGEVEGAEMEQVGTGS